MGNGTALCSPTAVGLWQGMPCRGMQETGKTEKKNNNNNNNNNNFVCVK